MEDEIFDMEQVLGMDDSFWYEFVDCFFLSISTVIYFAFFSVNDSDVLKILKTWRLTSGNEGAHEQQSEPQHQLGKVECMSSIIDPYMKECNYVYLYCFIPLNFFPSLK